MLEIRSEISNQDLTVIIYNSEIISVKKRRQPKCKMTSILVLSSKNH